MTIVRGGVWFRVGPIGDLFEDVDTRCQLFGRGKHRVVPRDHVDRRQLSNIGGVGGRVLSTIETDLYPAHERERQTDTTRRRAPLTQNASALECVEQLRCPGIVVSLDDLARRLQELEGPSFSQFEGRRRCAGETFTLTGTS